MEQRKHWWNGKWGRLARRDVFLRVDADRWHVEQRAGGAEGVSQFYEYDSADEASMEKLAADAAALAAGGAS